MKKLQKSVYLFIFSAPVKTSFEEMDISFMYDIVRNALSLKAPKKGWGEKPGTDNTDIDIADDIERIHSYRNDICHSSSSELPTGDFNESALDLIGVRPHTIIQHVRTSDK